MPEPAIAKVASHMQTQNPPAPFILSTLLTFIHYIHTDPKKPLTKLDFCGFQNVSKIAHIAQNFTHIAQFYSHSRFSAIFDAFCPSQCPSQHPLDPILPKTYCNRQCKVLN